MKYPSSISFKQKIRKKILPLFITYSFVICFILCHCHVCLSCHIIISQKCNFLLVLYLNLPQDLSVISAVCTQFCLLAQLAPVLGQQLLWMFTWVLNWKTWCNAWNVYVLILWTPLHSLDASISQSLKTSFYFIINIHFCQTFTAYFEFKHQWVNSVIKNLLKSNGENTHLTH